ncbi:zinc ion binding, partial [Rhizina undulata]
SHSKSFIINIMDSTLLLQEFLKYPVCLGTLVNPMSLPCTHTFCRECLVQTFTVVSQLKNCRCPICRAPSETAKKNSSIACLVDNFRAINGAKIPEDRSKESQCGDLNMAQLFEVKHDNRPIIVEDDQIDEDESEEELEEADVEEYGLK